jgi:hypothetical protein
MNGMLQAMQPFAYTAAGTATGTSDTNQVLAGTLVGAGSQRRRQQRRARGVLPGWARARACAHHDVMHWQGTEPHAGLLAPPRKIFTWSPISNLLCWFLFLRVCGGECVGWGAGVGWGWGGGGQGAKNTRLECTAQSDMSAGRSSLPAVAAHARPAALAVRGAPLPPS